MDERPGSAQRYVLACVFGHSLITLDGVGKDTCMRRTARPPCKRATPWHVVWNRRIACETCGGGLTRAVDMEHARWHGAYIGGAI